MSSTVLLVDDNLTLADNLREIFEEEGLGAEVVGGGLEALARLERGGIDLVVTDVRMPDMDGLEVLNRIHRGWPGLPVIIMTAYDSDSVVEAAQGAGALGVLPKPLEIERLLDLVSRVAAPSSPVLLVEDDRQLRVNLSEALLEVAEVVPYAVASYEAALRLADARSFSVAIIDARLPDGDGVALGRELQRRFGDGSVEIIYITGYAEQFRGALDQLLAEPQIRLLEKPFRPERLLDLVRAAI